MRRQVITFVVSCLAVVTIPAAAVGQPDGQIARINEVRVKPGMVAQFEQARQERNAHWASSRFAYPLVVSVGENLVYRIVGLYADEEALQARRQAVGRTRSSEDDSIRARLNEAVVSRTVSSYRTVPDAGHAPANPRVQGDDVGFIHYVFLYVQQGGTGQVLDVLRQIAAMRAEHDVSDSFQVAVATEGANLPKLLVRFPARNAADYYARTAEIAQTLGAPLRQLIGQVAALTRRIETSNNTVRPDLAYQPPS